MYNFGDLNIKVDCTSDQDISVNSIFNFLKLNAHKFLTVPFAPILPSRKMNLRIGFDPKIERPHELTLYFQSGNNLIFNCKHVNEIK